MTDILEEIRRLREKNQDISNEDILLIQVIEIKRDLKDMKNQVIQDHDDRISDLEKKTEKLYEYPSITYLFRYYPKQTVVVVVVSFLILSLLWVSTFRQGILEWLGLPIF